MKALSRLHTGDKVRFGAGRAVYVVEWLEKASDDHAFVIAHGPLGSFRAKSGRAFYVGPDPLVRLNLVTGEPETLKPVRVRVVNEHVH